MQYRTMFVDMNGPLIKLSNVLFNSCTVLNLAQMPLSCQVLRIKAHADTPVGSILAITDSLKLVYSELAANEEAIFIDYSGRNGVSTQDKMVHGRNSVGQPVAIIFLVSTETA